MKPSDPLLLADGTLRCRMNPEGKVAISRHLVIPRFPRVQNLKKPRTIWVNFGRSESKSESYLCLIDERVNNSEKEEPVQIRKIGKKIIKMDDMNSSNIYLLKLFSNLEMAFEG